MSAIFPSFTIPSVSLCLDAKLIGGKAGCIQIGSQLRNLPGADRQVPSTPQMPAPKEEKIQRLSSLDEAGPSEVAIQPQSRCGDLDETPEALLTGKDQMNQAAVGGAPMHPNQSPRRPVPCQASIMCPTPASLVCQQPAQEDGSDITRADTLPEVPNPIQKFDVDGALQRHGPDVRMTLKQDMTIITLNIGDLRSPYKLESLKEMAHQLQFGLGIITETYMLDEGMEALQIPGYDLIR